MKKCNRCQELKPFSEFHKQSQKLDGYRPTCKQCRKPDSSAYYGGNSEIVKKKVSEYRKNNPDYNKNYYSDNPNYFEQYRIDNKDHYRKWRKKNKLHLKQYRKDLRDRDPTFKVACSLRSRISSLIRKSGTKKMVRCTELIGCSINEFRKHLESKFVDGMTWDNYGDWHIDHIFPCSKFDLRLLSEQKKCFHYSNQQPLWKIDNLRKGNRLSYYL
jgi:hypothetical protein